jgi:hypothetical protein
MQTLESISKRYQINEHGEAYYTVELTDLMTGATDTALEFGSLRDIVNAVDASIFNAFGDDADPAQYRATISHGTTELVIMPTCAGPDEAIITTPQAPAYTYEIREIDAWMYDDSWTWNTSYRLGSFTTTGDPARAFRRAIKRLGVTLYKGKTVTEYDGDVYEIVDRKTRQPLFAAIPQEV